jgi:flagellar basal-body rod protein FlgB
MDWSTTSPLGAIKQRLNWLGQRQQVLARNIANADTPGFVPSDLKPLDFRQALRQQTRQVHVTATDPAHLTGLRKPDAVFAVTEQSDTVEATPSGNAVDLEQQIAKVSETNIAHSLGTQLYRKYLGMIRTAAGARG